jgi:hypothetical protein
MGSVSNLDRRLALTSEGREDGAVLLSGLIVSKRCGYDVLSKALDCMSLEV